VDTGRHGPVVADGGSPPRRGRRRNSSPWRTTIRPIATSANTINEPKMIIGAAGSPWLGEVPAVNRGGTGDAVRAALTPDWSCGAMIWYDACVDRVPCPVAVSDARTSPASGASARAWSLTTSGIAMARCIPAGTVPSPHSEVDGSTCRCVWQSAGSEVTVTPAGMTRSSTPTAGRAPVFVNRITSSPGTATSFSSVTSATWRTIPAAGGPGGKTTPQVTVPVAATAPVAVAEKSTRPVSGARRQASPSTLIPTGSDRTAPGASESTTQVPWPQAPVPASVTPVGTVYRRFVRAGTLPVFFTVMANEPEELPVQ
jgi:hypothetical protein